MDFVDDHAACRGQHRTTGFGTEQDVQRLGCGHHDMRCASLHRVAFGLRRVAGAHAGANFHVRRSQLEQFVADAGERRFQIDAHVVRQRLERGNVDDAGLVGEISGDAIAHQRIDRSEKRGQRLARSGRRSDQCMATGLDRRPCAFLRWRRRRKRAAKPGRDGGVEVVERHDGIVLRYGARHYFRSVSLPATPRHRSP